MGSHRATSVGWLIEELSGDVNGLKRLCFAEWSQLFLTGRAEERGAPALDDALDRAVASGRCAGMAFAVVDVEGVLEIAERSVGLAIVAQRRAAGPVGRAEVARRGAAGGGGIGDDGADGSGQLLGADRGASLLAGDGAGEPAR